MARPIQSVGRSSFPTFQSDGERPVSLRNDDPAAAARVHRHPVLIAQDVPAGKVRYSPPPALFEATRSPYAARWRIVDSAERVSFWPDRAADPWVVGL